MDRSLTYFVSDVHLGLDVKDSADREKRFVGFLRSIPPERTRTLYLLGDIWDFWYEYRDVVPRGYVRVLGALADLMDAGVEVCFFQGNHDIWSYSYFESLGMKKLYQPCEVTIGGKVFCLGHGDGLGPGMRSYKFMQKGFRCRFLQVLFSALHPWFAFRLGTGWSKSSRLAKNVEYEFKGEEEPLYIFAKDYAAAHKVDYFVFGHYHTKVDLTLPGGGRLLVLKDWMDSSPYLFFDEGTMSLTWAISGSLPKMDQ